MSPGSQCYQPGIKLKNVKWHYLVLLDIWQPLVMINSTRKENTTVLQTMDKTGDELF